MTSGTPYPYEPGVHSHNQQRRSNSRPRSSGKLLQLRNLLLLVGLVCVGYYAYTLADQKIYQAYENWAFEQAIAGHTGTTVADYIRQQTPFGILLGAKSAEQSSTEAKNAPAPRVEAPEHGSIIGRVRIGRLDLSAVVRQGVDADTLRVAVGHVPSTALPGQAGNFAIAAHRDTLFRALKDIQRGDLVTFQSTAGTYNYQVVTTKIVKPTDVSVLRPDGGGLIEAQTGSTPKKMLTMITCYPFYYVGAAPRRFVVQAKLVNSPDVATLNSPK
jgi:sortase A